MRSMKRTALSLLLALILCLSLAALPVLAETGAEEAAQSLNAMGLFAGVGNDEEGNPIFDLDRPATRLEALVMLIRLLGKEEEALACTAEHPFTDIPWGDRYVAYAYEQKLTNGMGETWFGAETEASAQMYLTFILRALGYKDTGDVVDFSYDNAVSYAEEKGLATAYEGEFDRGDIVLVSVDALDQPLKDSETTLIASLVEAGAVDAAAAAEQGFEVEVPEEPAEEPGITSEQGTKGLILTVTNQAGLVEAMNQTAPVEAVNIVESFTVSEDSGVSYEGDKLENYANVVVTVAEDVTLTVVKDGQLGVYWFTYEGDWETGTLPNGQFINNGTLVVEKDGWINGEFTENSGTVLVKDGGQCQTMPNLNTGTVTVETGGSYRTTQGQEAVNEGTVTIAEGANMVARFGSSIVNRGTLTVDGLLSIGYVYFDNIDGEPHEEVWLRNSGTLTGTGTARVYDALAEGDESENADRMLELMQEALGADTTLTLTVGVDTGV